MLKSTFVAIRASKFRLASVTHGGCHILHDGFVHFPVRKYLHGFRPLVTSTAWTFEGYFPVSLCLRLWGSGGRLFFSFTTTRNCFQTPGNGGNCMGLLSNSVHLLHTDSILTLSSQRWLSSLCDSWLLSLFPLFRSGLWNLINMSPYCCRQSGIARSSMETNILLYIYIYIYI